MKILHTVESYDPEQNGMQQVVKQLSERLVLVGHKVTVATKYNKDRKDLIVNGVEIVEFKIAGKEVIGYTAEESEINRYRDYLIHSGFDIITNFAAQQWATDIVLPVLDKIKAVKVFVPTGFSELHNPAYSKYFDAMKVWMKAYDMNVFLSDNYQDINYARAHEIKNTILIPNGAAEEEFSKAKNMDIRKYFGIPATHFLILNVGSHTGLKGHKDAIKIFKKAKIKNATLLILGNTTPHSNKTIYFLKFLFKTISNYFSFISGKIYYPACSISCKLKSLFHKFSFDRIFNDKSILVKEVDRDKTIASYLEADLFLFPSNVECSPLVLFECMASKTPFLTSDVGNTREIISWCNSGILLPTNKLNNGWGFVNAKKSAGILETIISDKKSLNLMKVSGYNAFILKFTWERIAKEYEGLYLSLLK